MGGYILVGSSRLLGGELRRDGGFLFKDLRRILEIGIGIFIGIFTSEIWDFFRIEMLFYV